MVFMIWGASHLHPKLRDYAAAVPFGEMVAISPLRLEELRALDDNLSQLDALYGVDLTRDHVDAGAQPEH